MSARTPWLAAAIAFLLSSTTAAAQRAGYSYLSYVGAEVSLVSNAEDDSSARLNTPILAGDRISTGSTSRAEAILADGNILRIDVQTDLRFDRLARTYEAEDDRNALYIDRGAVSLEHRWSTSLDESTRIDTGDVTVLFPTRGILRVETGRRGTEIYVVSGQADVYARSGRTTLRAGQYAFASGDAEVEVDWRDEPRDRFTLFVGERRDLAGRESGSQNVSSDYGYDYAVAGFEEHGSWILVDGSSVWRPSVAADWQPYVDGYWRWSPAGLTWVSYEPWGWLPYHYGSWDWDVGFGWYWSPGASYSPAWVYWSYTPSWVGWCPIGYYGGYYGRQHGRDTTTRIADPTGTVPAPNEERSPTRTCADASTSPGSTSAVGATPRSAGSALASTPTGTSCDTNVSASAPANAASWRRPRSGSTGGGAARYRRPSRMPSDGYPGRSAPRPTKAAAVWKTSPRCCVATGRSVRPPGRTCAAPS